jgi:hypothetical protein
VHLNRAVTDEDEENVNVHGGCSYVRGNVLGFDCGHAGDYPFHTDQRATYKDFPYVKAQLIAVIEQLI